MQTLSIRSNKVLIFIATISLIFLFTVEGFPGFENNKSAAFLKSELHQDQTTFNHSKSEYFTINPGFRNKNYNSLQIFLMLIALLTIISTITLLENRRNALGRKKVSHTG